MFERQEQSASDGGIATQAGRDIVINMGISYTEARNIAEDVFKNNFYKLSEVAANEVDRRINYITDKIIKEFQESNPEGINKFKDPGFQVSLYEVQKSYAKTGDMNLSDMLVDMLIERSKHDERSYIQIIMDEAITVIPKLTNEHLNVLSLYFIVYYIHENDIHDYNDFVLFIQKYIIPFFFDSKESYFTYLMYLGCGMYSIKRKDIREVFFRNYQGLFQNCFDIENIKQFENLNLFLRCKEFNKYKISVLNHNILDDKISKFNLIDNDKIYLKELFDRHFMNIDDIKNKCIKICPSIKKLFDLWDNTLLSAFYLTPVGKAIACANLKKTVGLIADLPIWIE